MERILGNPYGRIAIMLLGSLIFIIYKYSDIFLPYFWDEMAGYMSGVIYMLDHGISILPSAIPAESSYGHPLLVHFIMACVASVFGSSVAVMHTTTLIFTFAMALGTYLLALSLTKKHACAVCAYLLCLVQPVVVAQSTQVLLEVFLALTFVYAIYFYTIKRYGWSAFFCVLSVLTKETGLVIAIAFIVQHILEFMLVRDRKRLLSMCLLYAAPFIIFGAFLLIQKQTYGWYLNPVNVGKSKLDLASMVQKIWDYALEFTFINQGRFTLTIILLLAIAIQLVKRYRSFKWQFDPNIMLVLIFSFGFILFSSIADTLERYFLSLIPFAVILFSASILYFRRFYTNLPLWLLGICMISNLAYLDNGKKYGDADMSYRHLVKTSQMVFDYVNSGQFRNDTVGFAFPLMYAPLDERYGYFEEKKFIADTGFSQKSRYFIYCSPGNIDWNPPDTQKLKPMVEFRSGYSRALVYKK